MGLTELQPLLARLYTDAPFREAFLADPEAFGAAQGLGPDDLETVIRFNAAQIDAFAGSLIAKRRGEVCKLLPLSCGLLGERRFAELFRQHALQHVPSGIHKHHEDAVAFADFVAGRGARRSRDAEPPSVDGLSVDLLRYEAAWLSAADPARRWVAMHVGHDVERVAAALRSGSVPESRPGTRFHVWFRFPFGERPFHIVAGCPWFRRWSVRQTASP